MFNIFQNIKKRFFELYTQFFTKNIVNEFALMKDGTKIWYDMKLNSENYRNNTLYCVKNGVEPIFYVRPHREDGPAIVYPCGTEYYYIRGELHRADGPAVWWYEGFNYWYLNGQTYIFDDWCKKLNKSEEEINFLKLKWDIL